MAAAPTLTRANASGRRGPPPRIRVTKQLVDGLRLPVEDKRTWHDLGAPFRDLAAKAAALVGGSPGSSAVP